MLTTLTEHEHDILAGFIADTNPADLAYAYGLTRSELRTLLRELCDTNIDRARELLGLPPLEQPAPVAVRPTEPLPVAPSRVAATPPKPRPVTAAAVVHPAPMPAPTPVPIPQAAARPLTPKARPVPRPTPAPPAKPTPPVATATATQPPRRRGRPRLPTSRSTEERHAIAAAVTNNLIESAWAAAEKRRATAAAAQTRHREKKRTQRAATRERKRADMAARKAEVMAQYGPQPDGELLADYTAFHCPLHRWTGPIEGHSRCRVRPVRVCVYAETSTP